MAIEVLLMNDVQHLGLAGDVKTVKDGYARNYLFPQGLAEPVTKNALRKLEKLRKEKDKKDFSANVSGMKSRSKQSFNKMYDTANPITGCDQNEGYVLPRKLKRGDTVFVVDLGRKGIVSGDPDGSDFVFVQMGVMKTKMSS